MLQNISFYDLDDCESVFETLDVNNEKEVKKVIRYLILLPYYMEKKEVQKILKDTLAYYLTTENISFKDLYEHEMPSFEVTNNPKDLPNSLSK